MILAMYVATAEKQGASQSQLRGTIQNDLLKEYIARNTYVFGPEPSMRLTTDLCSYCAQNMPQWNSISICGYHMREAGATAIQEAAFTLADGITYVQAMIDRGMEVETLACALAGCQSLATTSYDEALALPSEEAVEIALRTQQIVAHESGVADTVDPLGGSYYIEWLTNHIEEGIKEYIDKIEEMGGAPEAIKRGYIQGEIMRAAYDYQQAVDSGEQVVVGVNKFTTTEKATVELLEIDESVEKKQIERVTRLKRERDNGKVRQVLDKVRKVAEGEENIMPVLVEAVEAYATVGEISDALRDVFGEYKEPSIL